MLKTRIGVVVVGASLALAGTALGGDARKIPQRGDVRGDAKAEARLVVVNQGGLPRSVKNVRIDRLRMSCSKGPARIDLTLSGGAKVGSDRTFRNAFGENQEVRIRGKVRRDGRRVAGHLSGTTIRVSGAGRCKVPDRDFVTRG